MFMSQSRAGMVPMNVPQGSPRQSGFGGKGGASAASAGPASGGKGGGRQMAPRNFDNNPGQQAGPSGFTDLMFRYPKMMGGPAIGSSAPSPQPTMFGQGNLNTAIGAALPTSNLQQAITSGQVYMTPMPNPQQDLPSGFAINREPPALPQGLMQRLAGFGGF